MIFEALYDSSRRGELLLVDGGLCRFHRRRDGVVTIREIIVLPHHQRQGVGRRLLVSIGYGSVILQASCPADLPANGWYAHLGFALIEKKKSRTGREINLWQHPRPD